MDNLEPPLLLTTREIRAQLASGKSMNDAIESHLSANSSAFAQKLRECWILLKQRQPVPTFESPLQAGLWELIERGVNGQPVFESLNALESEIEQAASHELELHLLNLPFKLLLPLLLLCFPAYLLLLLGPLIRELSSPFGG